MNLSIIFLGVLIMIFFIIIIVIVSVSRGRHGAGEQGGNGDMIKTVYIYLVLLATLLMTIGGSVAAFMAVADIVSPPAYYQSFADYQRMPDKVAGQNQPALTREEIKKNYDQLVLQAKQQARERAYNSLIKSFGWIVIPFPVFLYYQKKLKRDSNA